MNARPDSAQIAALLGTAGSFFLTHYDRLLAATCALIGILYTLWKWRRDYRRDVRADLD